MVKLQVWRAQTSIADVLARLNLTKESRQPSMLVVKYNRSRHLLVKVADVRNTLIQSKKSLADVEGQPAGVISRSRAARRSLPPQFDQGSEAFIWAFVRSRPLKHGLVFIDRRAAILID
jgi:hypothetical protein